MSGQHRACACPRRRHRLIRVTFVTAICVIASMTVLRVGVAVGSADLAGRTDPAVTPISSCSTQQTHEEN